MEMYLLFIQCACITFFAFLSVEMSSCIVDFADHSLCILPTKQKNINALSLGQPKNAYSAPFYCVPGRSPYIVFKKFKYLFLMNLTSVSVDRMAHIRNEGSFSC